MKKLLIILTLLISIANHAQAQTKEETVKWLTEKMMKDGFFGGIKITKVQFDDNFLTINGTSSYDQKNSNGIVQITTNYTYSNTIDLSKLTDNVYDYSKRISTVNNAIKINQTNETYGYKQGVWGYRGTDEYKVYSNQTTVKISESFEPDILDRFKKALKHYQSLMTVKKSNETF